MKQTPAQRAFWSYQAPATPELANAVAIGAIAADTTPEQWAALTPGMRREIVRSAQKR